MQFACCTRTKVQILTLTRLPGSEVQLAVSVEEGGGGGDERGGGDGGGGAMTGRNSNLEVEVLLKVTLRTCRVGEEELQVEETKPLCLQH
jgi:hypothetical protein